VYWYILWAFRCSCHHYLDIDTDVFLLLLHHAYGMDIKIWMMAGTSKSPENIPIHYVLRTMRVSASSCVAFKLSKFRLLSLLSAWSSKIPPPPVITTLPSGACQMSSVAKKECQVFFFETPGFEDIW
jgi:hypothetical protein